MQELNIGEDDRPASGGEETEISVLLVEDSDSTRCAMAAFLVGQGFQVLTAATVHDALGVCRQPQGSVDVVVLDIGLPDANGVQLCARLLELCPDMPIVVCSGEASPEEVAQLLRLGVRRYLQKPVTPDELIAAIEATLP